MKLHVRRMNLVNYGNKVYFLPELSSVYTNHEKCLDWPKAQGLELESQTFVSLSTLQTHHLTVKMKVQISHETRQQYQYFGHFLRLGNLNVSMIIYDCLNISSPSKTAVT